MCAYALRCETSIDDFLPSSKRSHNDSISKCFFQAPLLLLLVVMTHVLALLAPLLLLLFVMTHVLAPLAPILQWLVSRCRLIALVLALQYSHAFVLDKELFFDSVLVYNWKEDSFNHAMLHNNSLSDKTCTM